MDLSQWTREVKARGACERCGKTERLHAHHIDRDRTNNVLSNGECLCVWCHADEHDRPEIIALDEAIRNQTGDTRRKTGDALKTSEKAKAQRARVHKAKLGKPRSAETRQKLSKAGRGKKRGPFSDEHRAALKASWQPGGSRYHERRDQAVRESSETGPARGVE